MSDLRKAAQQALEALESADWYINQLEQIVYSDDDTDTHKERAKVQAAVTALRAALAEPVQEPVAWHHPDCEGECIACLIEREITTAFGLQGFAYLKSRVVRNPLPPLPAPTVAMRDALELIATPQRADGTWSLDRERCRRLAAKALGE